MTTQITEAERDAILAALRFWQDGSPNEGLLDLATNEGEDRPLSRAEIDDLCEKIKGAGRKRDRAVLPGPGPYAATRAPMVQRRHADRVSLPLATAMAS